MRHVMLVVEQLDRAAQELHTDHPINNRIALILIDNAVELVAHQRLGHHLQFERLHQKLSPKQRIMARSAYLDDRLKILRVWDDLNEREHEFINAAHSFRSELYHVGLRHDSVVRAIAARYFDLACELFVRLPRGFRMLSPAPEITPAMAKYFPGDVDRSLANLDVKDEVLAERLRAQLPSDLPTLQPILEKDAVKAIDGLRDGLDFLVSDNPHKYDLPQMLRLVQRQYDFDQLLARQGIEGTWMTPGYNEKVREVKAELDADWRPRYARVPEQKWRGVAARIGQEPDALKALGDYQTLRREMEYLVEAIGEAAADLDGWIQMEIDRARGK